jgi:hypothetical protein
MFLEDLLNLLTQNSNASSSKSYSGTKQVIGSHCKSSSIRCAGADRSAPQATPDLPPQLFTGDYFAAPFKQHGQDTQRLGLNFDWPSIANQGARVGIELEIGEPESSTSMVLSFQHGQTAPLRSYS